MSKVSGHFEHHCTEVRVLLICRKYSWHSVKPPTVSRELSSAQEHLAYYASSVELEEHSIFHWSVFPCAQVSDTSVDQHSDQGPGDRQT